MALGGFSDGVVIMGVEYQVTSEVRMALAGFSDGVVIMGVKCQFLVCSFSLSWGVCVSFVLFFNFKKNYVYVSK